MLTNRFLLFCVAAICSFTAMAGSTDEAATQPEVVYDYSADTYTGAYNPGRVSDAALIRDYTLEQARKMKKNSIIGGSCLAALGVATFAGVAIATRSDENNSDESNAQNTAIGGAIGGALVVGGGLWVLIAHYKANKMIQNVSYLTLMEQNLYAKGKNSLSASLDMVKSRGLYRQDGLGLSLRYTF